MTPHSLPRLVVAFILMMVAYSAAAQSSYRLQSGDSLLIEVLEDNTLNRSVVVLPDGRFSFPFAGTLPARGLTVGQIETAITKAIASNFASEPTVFVAVTPGERTVVPVTPETIDVYFLGEVNTPGERQMQPGTTFLQALAQAGGLTRFAAEKRIQLRRQQKLFQIDYRALSRGAALQSNITLRDGDVILVPERRLFE